MKKFYSIAMGLILGASFAQAADPIKNVTTDTEYTDLTAAYNEATSGDVIEIYESISYGARLTGSKSLTIKGVGDNITVTHTNGQGLFCQNSANGCIITLENLTLTSTSGNLTGYFLIEKANDQLILNNVTVKRGTNKPVFGIKVNTGVQITYNNVIFEGFDQEQMDITAGGNLVKLNLAGNNSFGCVLSKGQIVVGSEGITNTTPIKVDVAATNDLSKAIIVGCNDLSKFDITVPENYSTSVKGNDIWVETVAVKVTTDIEDSPINGTVYSSLNGAMAAVMALDPAPETATLALMVDQTFTSRFDAFPSNFNIVLTSADPANPVTIKTTVNATTIGLLANKSGRLVTLKEVIIDANGTTRTKQIFEATNSCGLRLENVIINNAKMSETDGVYANMFRSTSSGYFQLVNVAFGESSDQHPLVFCGTSTSSISGETDVTLEIQNDYFINAEGWTPSETCDVKLSGTRTARTAFIKNYTDLEKLNLVTEGYKLYVEEGNVMVTTADDDYSGIEEVELDANAPAIYYNLQGARVDNPAAGQLYIKRQAGKAVKVIL